jgi:hypothetical protein
MSLNYQRWQKLFLFGLGLAAGTAFCMKWMEDEFVVHGEKFTVIGLELSYSKERLISILGATADHVRSILRYHLSFDFAFMAGVYPGIAALCMMAREKNRAIRVKKLFFILAAFQTIAWGCDITENLFLFKWLDRPAIGNEFLTYHIVVWVKWSIALLGVLLSVPVVLRRRK